MTPLSFVVHIYRKRINGDQEVVGVVERVGAGSKRSFRTAEELWAFLLDPPRRAGRKKPQ